MKNKKKDKNRNGRLTKMGKLFIIRKLTICTISLIVAGISLFESLEWAFDMQRNNVGELWFGLFVVAIWALAYFWEETSTKYKERKKRRR